MVDIAGKLTLSDYSEAEFTVLLNEIFSAKGGDAYQDRLVAHFTDIVPNPEGIDSIFWVLDEEATVPVIFAKVNAYCTINNLESFSR